MANYPVVLYPKRIASFRQLAQHPKEAGGQQGIKAGDKKEGLQGMQTHSRRYSRTSQVFALRVLGSGLLVIGLLSIGKPVGILTLLLAGASWAATFFFYRTCSSSLPPESKQLVIPDRKAPSDELQTYLVALSAHMKGQVLQPDGVTDAPVGASERAFGQVLEKFFPGRVKAQLRLPIPNWDGAYSLTG
jgi:hypothetical protein